MIFDTTSIDFMEFDTFNSVEYFGVGFKAHGVAFRDGFALDDRAKANFAHYLNDLFAGVKCLQNATPEQAAVRIAAQRGLNG